MNDNNSLAHTTWNCKYHIGYNFLARHNVHKNLIIILKHPYTVKIYINLLLTFSILVLNCFVN